MENYTLQGKIKNKTEVTKELFLRWLSYFKKDNVSQFTRTQMAECGICRNEIRKYISILESSGDIENLTTNGYCYKIKLNTIKPCYKFLVLDSLTKTLKFFLLTLYEYDKQEPIQVYSLKGLSTIIYGTNNNSKSIGTLISRVRESGLNYRDVIHNSELTSIVCDNSIYENNYYAQTEYGFKVVNNSKLDTDKECKCKYCGETDPSKFNNYIKTTCTVCINKRRRDREMNNMSKWLLSKIKSGCKRRNEECIIDESYITYLLERQNYKCFYTNKEFKGDEYNSPSVDRVDSSKGYIKGNIVICRAGINVMKNDSDLKDFLYEAYTITKNINNIKQNLKTIITKSTYQ